MFLLLTASLALGAPPADDWKAQEAVHLRNIKAITVDFVRAGEGYFSPDGKKIIFQAEEKDTGNPFYQIFVMDLESGRYRRISPGLGRTTCPFFSPDGKRVIFRSDRKEKDRLQLYVINADGTDERALTDNDKWVYWAPFWYKDAQHIIYTAADHSDPTARPNYDLYWMNIEKRKSTRLTYAPGADVLPVFNPQGTKAMWTSSNRDGNPSSQLYIADFMPPKE